MLYNFIRIDVIYMINKEEFKIILEEIINNGNKSFFIDNYDYKARLDFIKYLEEHYEEFEDLYYSFLSDEKTQLTFFSSFFKEEEAYNLYYDKNSSESIKIVALYCLSDTEKIKIIENQLSQKEEMNEIKEKIKTGSLTI